MFVRVSIVAQNQRHCGEKMRKDSTSATLYV